jgi:uncharacterized membrane-anchored protein YitT (DUF2179 family)
MKDTIVNIILICLGNFLLAVSVACFLVPNDILSGGVAGLAVALLPIIPSLNTTLFITIATILLFIIGTILLGRGFFIKTLISTITYPVFLNILTVFMEGKMFTDNIIVASIYTGLFMGLGVGIVFRTGSSTGGMDIPALLMEKYLHVPLHIAVLIIDAITVILGIATYSVNAALIGLISVYVSSVMIDYAVSFGGQKTKSVMIISNHYEEMMKRIDKELERGMTLLHAEGGYRREDIEVLLCVVDNKQYPKLNMIVKDIDPYAFLIVQDAHEIHGNGFTYYKELEYFSKKIKKG